MPIEQSRVAVKVNTCSIVFEICLLSGMRIINKRVVYPR